MSILFDIIIPCLLSIIISLIVLPRTMYSHFHDRMRFGTVMRDGKPVSRARFLGGSSYLFVVLISSGIASIIGLNFSKVEMVDVMREQVMKIFVIFTSITILRFVGAIDDLQGTSRKVKVAALFVSASLLPFGGLWINNLYGLMGLHELPAWFGIPLTISLVMYFTMTICQSDGIEGMATGQSSISLLIIICICYYTNSRMSLFMACTALGFTATFFLLNFLRKKNRGTFLGMGGAMPLGYTICFIILCLYDNKQELHWGDGLVVAAVCTLLMPAWDMIRVLKSRFADHRPMFSPDRNLFFHKLMRLNFSRMQILLTILFINLMFVGMTSYLMNKHVNINILLIADIIIFFFMHVIINYFINKKQKQENSMAWEKSYGREHWGEEEEMYDLEGMGLQDIAQQILQDEETPRQKAQATCIPLRGDIAFIPDGMNSFERNVKRIIDCIAAGLSLVVFSPLMLFSYIVIKLDDGGPAIFKQERVGRFGRPFYIYKFRSMRMDAEKAGPQLSHASGREDNRMTKAGLFLREHHLDELPQLIQSRTESQSTPREGWLQVLSAYKDRAIGKGWSDK